MATKSISPSSDLSLFLTTDDDDSVSNCSSYSLDLSQDSIETISRRRVEVEKSVEKHIFCGENRHDFVKDPSLLVSYDKLIASLSDFGFETGSSIRRREEILRNLGTTDEGLIPFGEFVKCIKDEYRSELTEKLLVRNATTTTISESKDIATEQLRSENERLREENRNLKVQFEAMETACSKAEDELIRIRKELQQQLENVRNLTSKLRSDSDGMRIKCEDGTKDSTITRSVSDRRERRTSSHREAASKLLSFVEEVHRNLSEVKQTNRRVGRSRSLYRNSSCILASKRTSVTTQPRAVARAATAVSMQSRPSSIEKKAPCVAAQDRLPRYVKGGRSHFDRSQLIKKIVDDASVVIDTIKPILGEADVEVENSSENVNYFESLSSSKNVSDVIKRLHPNIPSTAVVTIMTRV